MRGCFTNIIFYLVITPIVILVILYVIWMVGGFNNCDICMEKIHQLTSFFK